MPLLDSTDFILNSGLATLIIALSYSTNRPALMYQSSRTSWTSTSVLSPREQFQMAVASTMLDLIPLKILSILQSIKVTVTQIIK